MGAGAAAVEYSAGDDPTHPMPPQQSALAALLEKASAAALAESNAARTESASNTSLMALTVELRRKSHWIEEALQQRAAMLESLRNVSPLRLHSDRIQCATINLIVAADPGAAPDGSRYYRSECRVEKELAGISTGAGYGARNAVRTARADATPDAGHR